MGAASGPGTLRSERLVGVGAGCAPQGGAYEEILEQTDQSISLLKKSASFVLASLRGSTYRSVRLGSLLAAALLDSLFEHPAGNTALSIYVLSVALAAQKLSFSANYYS